MVANLLGLVGLVLILCAIDRLAGGIWALLGLGVVLVSVAYSLHTWERGRRRPAPSSRRS